MSIRADPSDGGSASSASIFVARSTQITAERKFTRVGRPRATIDDAHAFVEPVSTRVTGSSGPQSPRYHAPSERPETEGSSRRVLL